MIRPFGDPATEDVFNGSDSRLVRRLPRPIWPVVRRKLDMLNAIQTLADLGTPPGNRLEALNWVDRSERAAVRGHCGDGLCAPNRLTPG